MKPPFYIRAWQAINAVVCHRYTPFITGLVLVGENIALHNWAAVCGWLTALMWYRRVFKLRNTLQDIKKALEDELKNHHA